MEALVDVGADIQFAVATFWLPALLEGDYSGITTEEEIKLDNWLANIGTLPVLPDDLEIFWAIDEISGSWTECTTILVVDL